MLLLILLIAKMAASKISNTFIVTVPNDRCEQQTNLNLFDGKESL